MAFLDMLGFSADVKRNWASVAEQPVERLMNIKRMASANRYGGLGGGLDGKFYRARVQTVSDSIMMSIALPKKCTDEAFGFSLFAICSQIVSAWSFAIDNGYTIRGGMELGEIGWTPSELIGPALIDAYLLESRVARWSRVVCGPQVLDRAANSPTALGHVRWGLLDVAHDGLVEVLHFDVYDRQERDEPDRQSTIRKVERIREGAGTAASKYDPFLKKLKDPWNGVSVTRQAMFAARDNLRSVIGAL